MPMYPCSEHSAVHKLRRQRGDILAESMIGVLLFAIAGMGISHIASNVAVSQRDAKVQHQVVNELRSLVINRSNSDALCANTALSTQNFSSQITVNGCTATSATVNGVAVSNVNAPIVLSAQINGIGEVRVGGQVVAQQ